MKCGIIVIAYNRPDCLSRLLDRLNECYYCGDNDVLLIISIDNSGSDLTEHVARWFEWKHGEKVIITYKERQGLINHILKCGDYLNEYNLDAAGVFEDDIYPSKDYYNFMKQSVEFYNDEDGIAEISLYSYGDNPFNSKKFSPIRGNGDVFLIQTAVSWGQIWLKKQWNEFLKWYDSVDDSVFEKADIPEVIKDWKRSWLKYHMAYCSINHKYTVMPYCSLATCYSAVGEHADDALGSFWQIEIRYETGNQYSFFPIDHITVRYDAYFESEILKDHLNNKGYNDICMDLNGLRSEISGRYLLSLKRLNYKVEESYGIEMKPIESNILNGVGGFEIFVYNLHEKKKNHFKVREKNKIVYYMNEYISSKDFFILWYERNIRRLERLIRRSGNGRNGT